MLEKFRKASILVTCAVITILLLKSILPHYRVIKRIALNKARALTSENFLFNDIFLSTQVKQRERYRQKLCLWSISLFVLVHTRTTDFFSLALQPPWALASFSVSWSFLQTVGLLGRVISSSQGLYLNIGQTQNKHIHTPNIHALCGIRNYDPSFQDSEDSLCLRPLGCCERRTRELIRYNLYESNARQKRFVFSEWLILYSREIIIKIPKWGSMGG
jgi:hypothetical protein